MGGLGFRQARTVHHPCAAQSIRHGRVATPPRTCFRVDAHLCLPKASDVYTINIRDPQEIGACWTAAYMACVFSQSEEWTGKNLCFR